MRLFYDPDDILLGGLVVKQTCPACKEQVRSFAFSKDGNLAFREGNDARLHFKCKCGLGWQHLLPLDVAT
jgi:hypothetical protein